MTTYTAEDFANAEFARHPSGVIAARFHDGISMPWLTADEISLSNYDMADYGWVPVREAADQPITLDALHDAWEGAEQAEECGPGDVVIRPGEDGRYEVIPVKHGARLWGETRILHRASKPESVTVEQLGGLLVEWSGLVQSGLRSGLRTPPLAEWLAERGVRAPKGGEK